MNLVMLGMAAGCLPCVVSTWQLRTRPALMSLMLMSLGVTCGNLILVLTMSPMTHTAHLTTSVNMTAETTGHASVMLLVIALEFATAMVASISLRRSTVVHAA